jgi:hypothetical protein
VIARLPSRANVPVEKGKTHTFAIADRDLRFFDAETGISKNAGIGP